MFSHLKFALLPIALGLAGVSLIAQADGTTAATSTGAGQGTGTAYIMMDHSRGDSKAMQRMKDKTVPIHHAGDALPPSGKPGEAHIMMNHSIGDSKSMQRMADKTIPIHRTGDALPPSNAPAQDYIMMDHTMGDAKAMQRMTDKTVPIKHVEGTGGVDTGPTPKPEAKQQ